MAITRVDSSTTITQTVVTGVQISYNGATTNIQEISYDESVDVTTSVIQKPAAYTSIYNGINMESSTTLYGTDIEAVTTPIDGFPNIHSGGEFRYFGWRAWHKAYPTLPDFCDEIETINRKLQATLSYLIGHPTILVTNGTGTVIAMNITINHIPTDKWDYTGKFAAFFLLFCTLFNKQILATGSTSNSTSVLSRTNNPTFDFTAI